MDYFWKDLNMRGLRPKVIVEPAQFVGGPDLNIACTQRGDLSAYAQGKLVEAWCAALPTLESVRMLWFSSRVPQRLFDAACAVPGVEGIYVKWSGIKRLDALSRCSNLAYLHLGSSPGIESLTPMRSMEELRWLGLDNLKRVSRLEPLGCLVNLDGLSLAGIGSAGRHVESLEPIGRLSRLRYLYLRGIRPRSGSLRTLFRLRNLERFECLQRFEPRDLEALRRRNPKLRAP